MARWKRLGWTVIAAAALVSLMDRSARADDADKGATTPTESAHFHPHLVGDLRAMLLIRADNNYFQHASVFRYDLPSAAGGVEATAGVELLPRVSVLAAGFYVGDGADRADAHLRLTSGALFGIARWSFLRYETDDSRGLAELAVNAGFGHYFLSESYVDPSLSPQVYSKDASGYGGMGGLEASAAVYGFRVVAAYAYHYAPASLSDRIDGSVYAGGHELSLGVGFRL
jgi:hypothetical protein